MSHSLQLETGRCETGNERRELFERDAMPYVAKLYPTALRLVRNVDDAQDLVQETLLRAYRSFHQYEPGTNCQAWLITILYNYFRDSYRLASREQLSQTRGDFARDLQEMSVNGETVANPETLLTEESLDDEVSAAIKSLPLAYRTVLTLVDLEELNYRQVARVLDVSIGTIKSRLSRGRQMMRSALRVFAHNRRLVRSA